MNEQLQQLLETFPENTRRLALEVRNYLLPKLNGCVEIPDLPGKLIGYGFGTDYKQSVCVILLSKKGVKIGFYKGAALPDPHQLLTGTGKVHRFTEISSENDLNTQLDDLLTAALKAYHERTAAE